MLGCHLNMETMLKGCSIKKVENHYIFNLSCIIIISLILLLVLDEKKQMVANVEKELEEARELVRSLWGVLNVAT